VGVERFSGFLVLAVVPFEIVVYDAVNVDLVQQSLDVGPFFLLGFSPGSVGEIAVEVGRVKQFERGG
jgi:hypothetical protein